MKAALGSKVRPRPIVCDVNSRSTTAIRLNQNQTIKENEELSDFIYQGKPAYALGVAHFLQAIAISFNSAPHWDCDHLNMEISKLDDSTNQTPSSIGKTTTYPNQHLETKRKEDRSIFHKIGYL
jgi:hypothetical protein